MLYCSWRPRNSTAFQAPWYTSNAFPNKLQSTSEKFTIKSQVSVLLMYRKYTRETTKKLEYNVFCVQKSTLTSRKIELCIQNLYYLICTQVQHNKHWHLHAYQSFVVRSMSLNCLSKFLAVVAQLSHLFIHCRITQFSSRFFHPRTCSLSVRVVFVHVKFFQTCCMQYSVQMHTCIKLNCALILGGFAISMPVNHLTPAPECVTKCSGNTNEVCRKVCNVRGKCSASVNQIQLYAELCGLLIQSMDFVFYAIPHWTLFYQMEFQSLLFEPAPFIPFVRILLFSFDFYESPLYGKLADHWFCVCVCMFFFYKQSKTIKFI